MLKETPKDIIEMQEALQSGKVDMVCKKAHKIKSSAGVIQAQKLANMLEAIEALGKKGGADDELDYLIKKAIREYGSIEKSLKAYIDAIK
ncbi:MAG: Hpt domain-containing protein [Flavobacteriia bacterium]|nr:Hpt domain-containing protein [Flavobacteriia bacterium]